MNEKIGVVVPVYKTEKYVAECIESILAQTYTNLRLILVDDGSPDRAGAICDEYAAKDSRITVVHQENAGVTRARARGVQEAADCDWIMFVDSDDSIIESALESFTQLISPRYDIITQYAVSIVETKPIQGSQISIKKYRELLIKEEIACAPWGKLFRRTLFNHWEFNIPANILVGEDLIMNLRLAFNSEKDVKVLQKEVYNYRLHNQSISNTFEHSFIYLEDLHQQTILSIPQEYRKDYVVHTIGKRYKRWEYEWYYKYDCKGMTETPFYKNLKKDIEEYKFKLSYCDKIIFNVSNKVVRFLIINLVKAHNIITRYINRYKK